LFDYNIPIVFKKYIPQSVKTIIKDRLWIFFKDSIDSLTGKRDKYTPPTRLMFDGPIGVKEFVSNGKEFKKLFLQLIKPSRSVRILDIGSGIGRKTLPLTKYLNKHGSYFGIEIVKKGVDWCNKNITKRFPNFRFIHVDIYNGFYNPKGKVKPNKFHFPFPDNYFDVVIATSVFTHMLPKDVQNYHQEIGRILKKRGKSYLTYFLINKDTKKGLVENKETLPFKETKKGYWTTVPKTPEIATAYLEKDIKSFYSHAGLNIKATHFGSWYGRKKSLSYQDIIISSKL
jgi:SAM-dependent methyltransferase